MSHAPTRFNNTAEENQYYGTDARTGNSAPPYLLPQQPSGPNFGQAAANQYNFQMMQMSGQMPPPPFMPRHPAPSAPVYQNTANAQASGPWSKNPYNNPDVLALPSPRAATQIDSRPPDFWHNNTHLMCINKGREAEYPISISFRPTTGPCTVGVALLNLELGRGTRMPHDLVGDLVAPAAARFANGSLLIDWPGYRQASFVLTLIDPRTRRSVTRAQLGAQATQHFKDFANSVTEDDFYEDTPGGAFRLGVDGVQYDQVRLVELYTKDGMTFRPQFALNAHFLSV
ncbi:hypothetical protein FB451DRAFT_1534675 [Mycena latifolia]|nr:hypothetical protein FB451DRAFT_1534675 [Mycena latifolia]